MIRNAPKHYETHKYLNLGSNGVDQVRSLQKCPMQLRGPNFCVNCNIRPVLHRVLFSYEMITNAPKHYETQKIWVWGPMGSTGCVHFEKFHRNFMVQTFALTALVQPSLKQVLCCNKTIPNAPKLHKTHQNLRIWSNGVDRVHSLRKILTRLHGTNFFTNCTSSAQIVQ